MEVVVAVAVVVPHSESGCGYWDMAGACVVCLPLACVHFLFLGALLALHIAAPAHLALAGPRDSAALRVVAPPTADGLTVLVLVAFPCHGSSGVLAGPAEVRRVLNVQQVGGARDGIREPGLGGQLVGVSGNAGLGDFTLACCLVTRAAHFQRSLVALLQLLADLVERRQLPPAGLDGAGARNTMALTGRLHPSLDDLGEMEQK